MLAPPAVKAREAVVGLDLLLAAEALAGVVALDPMVKHPEQTDNQVINNTMSDQYIFFLYSLLRRFCRLDVGRDTGERGPLDAALVDGEFAH